MPKTSVIERPPSEAERVEAWRLHVLIGANYPLPLAEKMAAKSYVDLHQAVDLVVTQGCRHQTAAEILL